MNHIISIGETHIGNEVAQTVNARELHRFLVSKQDFSTWIKKRIDDYGFIDGVDFCKITTPQKNGAPKSTAYGNGKIEYFLTLSMAKELSMVERNDKGQQARRYFIDCERQLKENKPAVPIPKTMSEALRLAADLWEEKERLALVNKEMAPKADVYDRIVDRNNLYNASQVAQKFGQSAVWLNKQLEQLGVYNRSVKRGRVFQQWFIDKGYGIMRETNNGHSQAMFYAEGEMWIVGKLTDEGLI